MYQHTKSRTGTKRFVYFSAQEGEDQNRTEGKDHDSHIIHNEMLEK